MNTEITIQKKDLPSLRGKNVKASMRYGEGNMLFAKMQEEIASLQQQYVELLQVNSRLRVIVSEQQKMLAAVSDELSLKELENTKLPVPVKNSETEVAVINEVKPKIAEHVELLYLIKKTKHGSKQQHPTLEGKTRIIESLYRNANGMSSVELFKASGLGKVTGSKYVNFFQHRGLVWFKGDNKTGRYYLTDAGRKFAEGETVELSKNKYRYHYHSGAMNRPRG